MRDEAIFLLILGKARPLPKSLLPEEGDSWIIETGPVERRKE
jgi:hypothetical protein